MIRGSIMEPMAIQSVARLAENDGQNGNGLPQRGTLYGNGKGVPGVICG